MRFSYDQAVRYLARGECARREGWSLRQTVRKDVDTFYRAGKPVKLTDADQAANDWIVYRRG